MHDPITFFDCSVIVTILQSLNRSLEAVRISSFLLLFSLLSSILIVRWLSLIFLAKQNWFPETDVWFVVEIELNLSGLVGYYKLYTIFRLNCEAITNFRAFLSVVYLRAEGELLYSSSQWTYGSEQIPILVTRISLMLGNFLWPGFSSEPSSFVLDFSKIASSWVLNIEIEFVCLEYFERALRTELFWLIFLCVGFFICDSIILPKAILFDSSLFREQFNKDWMFRWQS